MQITEVRTPAQWRDFHHLPHRIYRDDPHWVPQLLLERKLHFTPKHNPFFQHAEAEFFLAYDGATPVGRITAQIDQLHLARYHDDTGHFGFIEALDRPDIFAALIESAENWLRHRGMKRVLGPVSFSMWDQPGLLVEGFDTPPSVMMGHARRWYGANIEAAGYAKAEDLLAYIYRVEQGVPPKLPETVDRAVKHWDIRIRPIRRDRRHIDGEIALMLDIINDAWSNNWGFVEMTKAEMADFAAILKLLLRPGDVAIGEYRGQPAAFAAIFPNLNEAIRDLNGRLLPFGWAKLLWRLKVRRPRSARMPLLGVRKEFQNSMLGAGLALSCLYTAATFNGQHGVTEGELSWILERNKRVRQVIDMAGAIPYKRYRIYEKAI